jgi:hypothetical protein
VFKLTIVTPADQAQPHAGNDRLASGCRGSQHDPEKWELVFGKDHARSRI